MINLAEMDTLPCRRLKEHDDRERLAAERLAKGRAKHKGRNHWRNWERRLMALERKRRVVSTNAKTAAKHRQHVAKVRAYWAGEIDFHP